MTAGPLLKEGVPALGGMVMQTHQFIRRREEREGKRGGEGWDG
jgi:hypothetical protein